MFNALQRLVRFFARPSFSTFFSKDGTPVHVSNTGRVWVRPEDLVRSPTFQAQVAAVRRLRLMKERAAQSKM